MTPRCISTEALALFCFCNVREVTNFSVSLTSCILELSTASLCNGGSLWSYDGAVAAWSVFAIRSVFIGVAHVEEQAVTGPVVGEGFKDEEVAVNVGTTDPTRSEIESIEQMSPLRKRSHWLAPNPNQQLVDRKRKSR